MRFFALALVTFASSLAFAYPEMIRHGYVNCTACHISPAGGGVLTQYGRGLSAELLSTWGTEKEAQFMHGALPMEKVDEWLAIGGGYRGLQYHYENDQRKDGQWIDMQGLIETAAKFKTWTVDFAFGVFEANSVWKSYVSRYYVMNNLNDYVSLRAGRFTPQFGLNIPAHTSPTRGNLGFGANKERNAFEAQYADEAWTVTGTYSESIDRTGSSEIEKAVAFKLERAVTDIIKPGISVWKGETPSQQRQLMGLHGLIGFTKDFFLLSEIDWQETRIKDSGAISHTLSTYHKLGYEVHKGVVGFLLADGQLNKLEDPGSRVLHYGMGVQFFPRPHFALEATWTREQAPAATSVEGDYAWFLFHYYL